MRALVAAALFSLAACNSGATRVLVVIDTPSMLAASLPAVTSLELAVAGADAWSNEVTLGRAAAREERLVYYPTAGATGVLDIGAALRDGSHTAILAGVVRSVAIVPGALTEVHITLDANPDAGWSVDLAASTLEAQPADGVVADGRDSAFLRVGIVDRSGNPMNAMPIVLELAGAPTGARFLQPLPTATSGLTGGRLSSIATGVRVVRARVGATPRLIASTAPVSFVGDPGLRLVFVEPPSNAVIGTPFSAPLHLRVVDQGGTPVTSIAPKVRLLLSPNAAYASLHGKTRKQVVDGEVSFDGISVDLPGEFTIEASAPGMLPTTSPPFTIAPGAWRPSAAGMWGGTLLDVVANGTRPGELLLMTNAGLFRSRDGGTSWTAAQQTPAFPVFSPSEDETFWVGSADATGPSVRRSDTLGDDLELLPAAGLPAGFYPGAIWIDARDPNTVFLGDSGYGRAGDFVYRSDDGGLTAKAIPTAGTNSVGRGVLAFAQTATSLFVVVTADDHSGAELFRSRDQGTTWTQLPVPPSIDIVTRAIADTFSSTLYISCPGAIVRSNDDGDTFEPAVAGLPGLSLGGIDVSPVEPSHLLVPVFDVTGSLLYGSDDEARSWHRVTEQPLSGLESIRFDADGQHVYAVEDSDFLVSADGGAHFTSRVAGIRAQQMFDFAIGAGGRRLASSLDGSTFETLDDGSSWTRIARLPEPSHVGIGPTRLWIVSRTFEVLTRPLSSTDVPTSLGAPLSITLTGIAVDPVDDALYVSTEPGQWRVSADLAMPGAPWPNTSGTNVFAVATDPTATTAGVVVREQSLAGNFFANSTDGGQNATTSAWPGTDVRDLFVAGSLIVARDDAKRVRTSKDGGTSWSELTGANGFPATCDSLSRSDSGVLWWLSGTALFRSLDGLSATAVPGPPIDLYNTRVFAGRTDDELVLGTQLGVWVTTTAGQ